MSTKITVFLSSRGDELKEERDAVNGTLGDIDGLEICRFEEWPSGADPPIDTCLQEVRNSNILILILGGEYGDPPEGCELSSTHLEYKEARENGLRILPFKLYREQYEEEQKRFIKEVESNHFRCQSIKTISELQKQVKDAVKKEIHSKYLEWQRNQIEKSNLSDSMGDQPEKEINREDVFQIFKENHKLLNEKELKMIMEILDTGSNE